MSFIVSARKYRPQHFTDVLGQSHITDTLLNAIEKDKLAHAFLFTGPRGVGKTTCARILAKVINCENVSGARACNECTSCKSFNENASFNILELDGASHNSVEQMRTLIEQVRFQPQRGRYKVFIIDEVHMLTTQAFNAFLKTLEEPPPYAIFILATTEKHKIIPTILSRCQIFDFKRIQIRDIVRQLELIAKRENIDAESDALYLIAEKADGAMRDALSIFDRIANAVDGSLRYQDVIEKLNILDYDYYFKMTDAILREDGSDCLLLFNQILKNGFEGDQLINGLSEHFRNLLLCKDVSTRELLELGENLKERYAGQSEIFNSSHLMTALDLCNTCDIHYPKAKNKRLHVEVCLLKLCYAQRLFSQHIVQDPVSKKQKKTSDLIKIPEAKQKKAIQVPSKTPVVQTEPPSAERRTDSILQNTPSLDSIESLIKEVRQKNQENSVIPQNLNIDGIKLCWAKYTEELNSPSIKAVLNKAILELEGKELLVEVPSQIAKDIVLQETVLVQEIRAFTNAPDLILLVKINKEKFPEQELKKPKNFLTVKEKFDELQKTNPLVKDLIKSLDLKIDNEY